jgi:hypothetical protein
MPRTPNGRQTRPSGEALRGTRSARCGDVLPLRLARNRAVRLARSVRLHGCDVTLRSVEDDRFVTSTMLVGFAAELAEKDPGDRSGWLTARRRHDPARRLLPTTQEGDYDTPGSRRQASSCVVGSRRGTSFISWRSFEIAS